MSKYNDLELSILSCLLQNPKLMNEIIIEDKHFIKHKKIWLFMKAFYKRYGNFDFNIMYSISKNKYRIVEYLCWIVEKDGFVSRFKEYQERLIELYNQNEKEKEQIEKIYEFATELYVGNMKLEDFKKEMNKMEDL